MDLIYKRIFIYQYHTSFDADWFQLGGLCTYIRGEKDPYLNRRYIVTSRNGALEQKGWGRGADGRAVYIYEYHTSFDADWFQLGGLCTYIRGEKDPYLSRRYIATSRNGGHPSARVVIYVLIRPYFNTTCTLYIYGGLSRYYRESIC